MHSYNQVGIFVIASSMRARRKKNHHKRRLIQVGSQGLLSSPGEACDVRWSFVREMVF